MTRTPVLLLTGFLGSGKTSLLNRLLRDPRYAETAVVINEAGDIGIDQALVERGSEDVFLLEGGCICCRLRGGLNETLHDLHARRRSGAIAFRRVIVETSGLSDPAPVMSALLADPRFMRHFTIAGVTTVVDAVNFAATHRRFPEARMQTALADRLVVSKTDMVDGAATQALLAQLAGLNPHAARQVAPLSGDDGDLVWIAPTDSPTPAPMPGRYHASEASGDIATAALSFPGRLPYDAVNDWLDHMTELFGDRLLRLKGILLVEDVADPVILHGVQGFVYSPGGMAGGTAEASHMVLIGHEVGREDLADCLSRLAQLAL